MKMPNIYQKPAIRGSRIAGFLFIAFSRNKTYCILICCIFIALCALLLTSLAEGLETSSSLYSADFIDFIQGGGGLSSTNNIADITSLGKNFGLFQGMLSTTKWLISGLGAQTETLGPQIQERTWQKDNDPYFYWNIDAVPTSEVSGFSVSMDTQPQEVITTYAPYYQFPENSVTSGKHTFYVLPFTSGNVWSKDNQLKFEIWVDVNPPIVNSLSPSAGYIISNNLVPISCLLYDQDSGLNLNSTTLTVDDSSATFSVKCMFPSLSGFVVSSPTSRAFKKSSSIICASSSPSSFCLS